MSPLGENSGTNIAFQSKLGMGNHVSMYRSVYSYTPEKYWPPTYLTNLFSVECCRLSAFHQLSVCGNGVSYFWRGYSVAEYWIFECSLSNVRFMFIRALVECRLMTFRETGRMAPTQDEWVVSNRVGSDSSLSVRVAARGRVGSTGYGEIGLPNGSGSTGPDWSGMDSPQSESGGSELTECKNEPGAY